MEQFKYSLLKAINVSGLTFLEPVVRLCYGEEPAVQIKKIFRFIVVPICAFGLFLVLWTVTAKNIQTKSGTLPTPYDVWVASKGIWTFHVREGDKQVAYELSAEQREAEVATVTARLEELKPLQEQATQFVAKVEAEHKAELDNQLVKVDELYNKRKAEYKAASKKREDVLKANSAKIDAKDKAAKEAYLAEMIAHLDQGEVESESLKTIKQYADEIRNQKSSKLVEATRYANSLAEETQYLNKKLELLTSANRSVKVEDQMASIEDSKTQLGQAQSTKDYLLAKRIVKSQERMQTVEESSYAKPYTLPMQIVRSLFCVFAGFLLATAIAIPVGVICGLSSTFMAAVTPFIALFKPVSPIVWLPISLIVVSGLIPDPETHWLTTTLEAMPLIGWMKINAAFISSAITVALCSLWPTLVNTALGVASIDKDHINVARVLRLGFFQRLIKIVIPSSLPLIFAGLRISLGVGWMVLIAAELLSSSEGIGKFVWDMFNNGSSETFAQMFVVVFIVGVVGLFLDRMMIVFQRLVSFDGAPTAI